MTVDTPVRRSPPRYTVVLARDGVELTRWELVIERAPDLAFVDELARLQLAASRRGCTIAVPDACARLAALLDLVGLAELLLGSRTALGREVGREPEETEEIGVEEVVMPDDPVA